MDNYSGTTLTFTYNDFIVMPYWCDTEINCVSVSPSGQGLSCQELVNNNGDLQTTWNFDGTSYETIRPGTYTYTYNVCVNGLPTTCKTFTVSITLTDPCNPAANIQIPDLDD